MKIGDLVKHYRNSKNFQEKFEIKKLKLKENNLSVNDLLNIDIPLTKKIKRFDEV